MTILDSDAIFVAGETGDLFGERLDLFDWRVLFLLKGVFLLRASSSEDTSYKSSKSVASVMKLSLVQGADDGASELSATEEASEVHLGAAMKWLPRGVGKASLRGDSHNAVLGMLSWGSLFRPLSAALNEAKCEIRIIESSSTSNIVLSDGRLLGTGPKDDAGRYVVEGNCSIEVIFSVGWGFANMPVESVRKVRK
jgi:hypothetical protein